MPALNTLTRRSLFAGSVATAAAAALPAAAAPGGDAVLLETWRKLQDAMAHHKALTKKMEPLYRAAIASIPPIREGFQAPQYPDAAWFAFETEREGYYTAAWNEHGLTAVEAEHEHLWEAVIGPLTDVMRTTAPTTLQGVIVKALCIRDFERPELLRKNLEALDIGEDALRQLIEQLAALA